MQNALGELLDLRLQGGDAAGKMVVLPHLVGQALQLRVGDGLGRLNFCRDPAIGSGVGADDANERQAAGDQGDENFDQGYAPFCKNHGGPFCQ